VEVRVGSVLTLALWRDISQPALKLVVLFQALQVLCILVSNFSCCRNEVVHACSSAEATVGNVNGTIVAVVFTVAFAMVCFEALEVRHDLIGTPSLGLPAVEVGSLRSCVPEIDVSIGDLNGNVIQLTS
jgi:hypothetical protein